MNKKYVRFQLNKSKLIMQTPKERIQNDYCFKMANQMFGDESQCISE